MKQVAGQSESKDTTGTFLAVELLGVDVIGYDATRTDELDLDEAAAACGVGKRKYPVAATLLARLAVDHRFQGRGVGAVLLVDALTRLADASHSVGFELVVVDAIDQEASTCYRRFGFHAFQSDPLRLFLPTKDLRASFNAASA